MIYNTNSDALIIRKKEFTWGDKIKERIFQSVAFSDNDGDYGIKTLSEGNTKVIHIFVNGFLNDSSKNNFSQWMRYTKGELEQNDTFLGFDWPSGKDFNIKEFFKKPESYLALIGTNIPSALLTLFAQTISEWKSALANSQKYSVYLADYIMNIRDSGTTINLYGHSLGANLIYETLKRLDKPNVILNNVYLFGGASKIDEISWTEVLSKVNGIYNFYTKNDSILKYLYQFVELGEEPIGLNKITVVKCNNLSCGEICNFDVSFKVKRHFDYISNFENIYYKIHCSR